MMPDPFRRETDRTLVAVKGLRGGYLQLAQPEDIRQYGDLSDALFLAARDWAARLEALGAERVYWLMLADVVPHLHLHLYPRWPEDTTKGIPLFEARNTSPQPTWTEPLETALTEWVEAHQTLLIPNND
jgi:diadenosine tetraphosphate (Ap4A) HIT family hydrolase